MIYVFHNSDPLAPDDSAGARHFRALHRALRGSGLPYRLVAARLQAGDAPEVTYISRGPSLLRFQLALWAWFWRRRDGFGASDVFHFHRNYAAWPKLVLTPAHGRVLISDHDGAGRAPDGGLASLAHPLRALLRRLEHRAAALADAVIRVDREGEEHPARGAAFRAAHVAPGLINRAEASPPPPRLATRLLLLGRICHQKNVPLAVETLEQLVADGGDYTLTVAGSGEDSKELMRRLARSPVAARVRWIGRVPQGEVPGLLAEHGILLLTSRYEASPGVVKEALRSMRPVVSTDVGDVADWVEPERTGWVCAPSAPALAAGVRAATRLILEGRYGESAAPPATDERAVMERVLRLYRWLAAV